MVFDFAMLYLANLRWKLITNRKSYGLSIATKVVDFEWPWTSIHCSVVNVMNIEMKRLRLESHGFRYKVSLYCSYLQIKFDDEINFNHNFLITYASKVKLTFRLTYIYSQSLLSDTSVTCMICRPHTDGYSKAQTTVYGTPMISSCGYYTVIYTSN